MAFLSDKKQQERRVIDLFKENYRDFPRGRLVVSESPDFILRTSPKYSIGIELVSLHLHNDPGYSLISAIETIIYSKEKKLPLYRKKILDQYWLLIYIDLPRVLPTEEFTKIPGMQMVSAFHRIFFLRIAENEIFEIK